MNAVTVFHQYPSMGDGLRSFIDDPTRSVHFFAADAEHRVGPRDPGYRHAETAVSGDRGSGVYNARRFNCDPTAYPRILRLRRVFQLAPRGLKTSLPGQ